MGFSGEKRHGGSQVSRGSEWRGVYSKPGPMNETRSGLRLVELPRVPRAQNHDPVPLLAHYIQHYINMLKILLCRHKRHLQI